MLGPSVAAVPNLVLRHAKELACGAQCIFRRRDAARKVHPIRVAEDRPDTRRTRGFEHQRQPLDGAKGAIIRECTKSLLRRIDPAASDSADRGSAVRDSRRADPYDIGVIKGREFIDRIGVACREYGVATALGAQPEKMLDARPVSRVQLRHHKRQ
jgi:hypothetical protein